MMVIPDLPALESRLDHLHAISVTSAYARQKHSTKNEFKDFLSSLPGGKTLHTASPKDILEGPPR